jgi:hypothetical protein
MAAPHGGHRVEDAHAVPQLGPDLRVLQRELHDLVLVPHDERKRADPLVLVVLKEDSRGIGHVALPREDALHLLEYLREGALVHHVAV